MEAAAYEEMAALEGEHWWFVGRRRIIDSVLDGLPLRASARILEIGCGSGGNLEMLSRYGTVYGAEYDAGARERAAARGVAVDIEPCALPDLVPFAGQTFDLVAMFDVLEHIEDDVGSLQAARSLLDEDGWIVLTVPAFRFLWSEHDVANHHVRRYTPKMLKDRLVRAGFRPVMDSFFNFWLFPAVALVRYAGRLRPAAGSAAQTDLAMPGPVSNRLLTMVFASERRAMGRVRLPYGVSCIMTAQPAAAAAQ